MKVSLVLADAAAAHPDKTCSILRGGISRIGAPQNTPVTLIGAAVVFFHFDEADIGQHRPLVSLVDVPQRKLYIRAEIALDVKAAGFLHMIIPLRVQLPRDMQFTIDLTVGDKTLASWQLRSYTTEATPSAVSDGGA